MKKFREMVLAQGGDPDHPLPAARFQKPVAAARAGFVQAIAADQIGYALIALGGGRQVATDRIDSAVGFDQPKKIGEPVAAGEPLLVMHYNDADRAGAAERLLQPAWQIADSPVTEQAPLITQRIV